MTPHTAPSAEPDRRSITEGPRWYRRRLRILGPFLGLVPMAVLGTISFAALELGDGREAGLVGLLAGGAAAPGLLVAGAPFADDTLFPLAILASVPLWLLLGLIASRRATRRSVASWRDYGRELTLLSLAVVLGAALALAIAAASLGQSLVI